VNLTQYNGEYCHLNMQTKQRWYVLNLLVLLELKGSGDN
jgi:hypothetical protein